MSVRSVRIRGHQLGFVFCDLSRAAIVLWASLSLFGSLIHFFLVPLSRPLHLPPLCSLPALLQSQRHRGCRPGQVPERSLCWRRLCCVFLSPFLPCFFQETGRASVVESHDPAMDFPFGRLPPPLPVAALTRILDSDVEVILVWTVLESIWQGSMFDRLWMFVSSQLFVAFFLFSCSRSLLLSFLFLLVSLFLSLSFFLFSFLFTRTYTHTLSLALSFFLLLSLSGSFFTLPLSHSLPHPHSENKNNWFDKLQFSCLSICLPPSSLFSLSPPSSPFFSLTQGRAFRTEVHTHSLRLTC